MKNVRYPRTMGGILMPPAPNPQGIGGIGDYAGMVQKQVILNRGGVLYVNQGYDDTQSDTVNAGATYTGMISVTVPQGSDQSLLVTHFGNTLNDIGQFGNFTWNMYIDDIPVPEYFGVVDQLGTPNQMREIGIDILVNSGQTLRIDIVSAAALAYIAGVSLKGVYGNYDYQKG